MAEDTAITIRWHKPLSAWTKDDKAVIVRRLRDFLRDPRSFDPRTGRPRKRRKKP
jgi:hypothetical protein